MRSRTLNPRKCDRCPVLLSRDYPHNLCPSCWKAQYGAPPGKFSPWYRPGSGGEAARPNGGIGKLPIIQS